MAAINKVLKEKLKGENLSYLTKKLGLPKGFLHRIVKENRLPSFSNLDALISLANYLNISLEYLLTGKKSDDSISTFKFEDKGQSYKITIKKN